MHRILIVISISSAALFSAAIFLQGAALGNSDTQFMNMAAMASMTEAHLGQMAEAQASRTAVKEFGQKLSNDHTNAYEGLTVLASKTSGTIPKAIGHDKTIERLVHLKGKAFDHAFLQDEVQSHKVVIAAFKTEAEHGENADVKAWAKTMIPILEGHLQTAESLEKLERPRK